VNEQKKNTLWKPGQSGNPAGRPPGSKDKKWASLDYWFSLVENEWADIKPETRVKVAIEAWKALIARKQFSLTPEESVANTEASMRMLAMLQDVSRGGDARISPAGDPPRVGDGGPEPHAESPTIPTV
jgi:uncharacterized protein YbdZ (MbtH family)